MLARKDVVAYFVKAMCHYKDKEMLVIPFNMGNHWLFLLVSTTYDQIWYYDSHYRKNRTFYRPQYFLSARGKADGNYIIFIGQS
jgi:hypothetical protein